ncbi:hypothetical protein [Kocuria sabuli]|uniref:hypothetical protein n=1 Tax=Kocuria sabuli TaxID=3071448 RepID=UPI0034D6CF3B
MIEVEATFLPELSMVERIQPHSAVTGVTMSEEVGQVQCVAGPSVTIPCTAGRARIAQLFSDATGPLVLPCAGETQSYPDDP